MKSTLLFVGGVLVALGVIICGIGIGYSNPESIYTLDPMLEVTKDSWLLFLEGHSVALIIGGAGAMFIGAALSWLGELIPKGNHFKEGKWERRILR